MDLTEMILNSVGKDKIMDAFSQTLNEDKDKVAKATTELLPALLSGMSQNIKKENGLESLMGAITQHENDKINNPLAFLDGLDLKDGQKILGHLLGSTQKEVQKEVAQKSGLSSVNTGKLMAMLAPLIMGYLGNQKKSEKGFDSSVLVKMLAGAGASSILSNILKEAMNPKTNTKNTKKEEGNVVADILGKLLK